MKKKLSKIMAVMVSLFLMLSLTACSSSTTQTTSKAQTLKKVGILQVVEHPSLNEIREAIVKELGDKGFKDGENITIDYQNAQGDQSNLKTMAQKFVNGKYDLIIAIATPSAQAVVSETKEIPIVFSAVLDPIGAGVIQNFEKPGGNVTGTSNAVSAEKVMELASQITPGIKKIGTVYNPGESNAAWVINSLKEYTAKNNINLVEATVTNSSEVQQAANSLVGKVDAIFIPNDNTVATAMPVVSQIAIKAKLPVYVTADSLVRDGGLATNGINYTTLGQETADMAVEVLNGKKPGDISAKTMSKMNVYLNKDTANALGITFPEELLKQAVQVVEKK
ncbi:ABC transporter substrate-binding protein [Desulfitobacterium metallireducens]|uniref:Peptide ABC transporter substrate-binding protein n=1 Tax=Desulfitobacterium metallireducens DSM 15288 TaxID=871968 RepID=W0EAY2_9FIRM|nr:ABC transporter substrate-binding protein [Desulfitobacterium metallireducens]AHF06201.1 peptide ABC transporter substrate-binding protein [Desulfitobacterium metallireducens DSM 15288]